MILLFVHADCTEEPLLRQVPDVTTKRTRNMYQFDSSQDSFISSKSYSEHHSQLASNEHTSLPNSEKEIILTTIFDQECAKAAIWPTVTMKSTDMPVPAFSNIVEVVSATEGTNIATNDSQLDSNVKNSTPVSPATLSTQTSPTIQYATKHQEQQTCLTISSVVSLSAQTSPSIQYATKHQEQQTCPTMHCVPSSSVVNLSTQTSPTIQCATKHQEQQTCPTTQCVPLSSLVSLSTQTSPTIQYATKHQEQQTFPTMQSMPLSSVVSLSARTSPSIQYATKHQEQQTCPITQCVPLSSLVSLSAQTSPSIQYATKHQEQQTSPGTLQYVSPLQSTTTDAAQPQSHTSLKSDKEYTNAFTQAGLVYTRELTTLKQEVNRLKEELGSAESTVIWQSLMLKIKDI